MPTRRTAPHPEPSGRQGLSDGEAFINGNPLKERRESVGCSGSNRPEMRVNVAVFCVVRVDPSVQSHFVRAVRR